MSGAREQLPDLGFCDLAAAKRAVAEQRALRREQLESVVDRQIAALADCVDQRIQADRYPHSARLQGGIELRFCDVDRRRSAAGKADLHRRYVRQQEVLDGDDVVAELRQALLGIHGNPLRDGVDDRTMTEAPGASSSGREGDA